MTSLAPHGVFEVGSRVAAARRTLRLSQKQLAVAVGASVWEIDRIEAGVISATSRLCEIAAVIGHDDSWFRHEVAAMPLRVPETKRPATPGDPTRTLLIIGSVALLVTVRFFTEIVAVAPRAANFVDIPIAVVLGTAALFARNPHDTRQLWSLKLMLPSAGFLALSVLSAVVNSPRTEIAPVLVFIYGFLAPLAIFASVYRLWPSGNARALNKVLISLGFLQLLVVGLVDVPKFIKTRNPDDISGTFGTNAYQLVFFLLIFIALVLAGASLQPRSRVARLAPFITVGVFITILLAQYRALLVSMVVAMAVTTVLLGGRVRGLIVATATTAAFVIVFHFVAVNLPRLKLQSAAASLAGNPGEYVGGRLHVFGTVSRLYGDLPESIVVGTGPGTYSSRAWQTFANAGSTSRSNVAGAYASGLTHGRVYETDVSTKYVLPQIQTGLIVQGSHAVSSPYSSYASLLAEVGIVGFGLIVSVYFGAIARSFRMARFAIGSRRADDAVPALALATVVAFVTLAQMAFLENWLEVARVTFVAWTLLAVTAKELDAKGLA